MTACQKDGLYVTFHRTLYDDGYYRVVVTCQKTRMFKQD